MWPIIFCHVRHETSYSWMNEQINELMNERKDEWTNDKVNEWTD